MTAVILTKAQLETTLKFFRRDIRGQWQDMDTVCVDHYNNIIKVMEHQIQMAAAVEHNTRIMKGKKPKQQISAVH